MTCFKKLLEELRPTAREVGEVRVSQKTRSFQRTSLPHLADFANFALTGLVYGPLRPDQHEDGPIGLALSLKVQS